MPNFTKGPWGDGHEALCVKVDRERPWASTVFRSNHDGSEANALVAMTFGATVEEATANARLIAAAPELVEALRHIAKQWPDSFAARTARAALRKAGVE